MSILSDLSLSIDKPRDFDSVLSSNLDGYIDPSFSDAVERVALSVVSEPHINNMGCTYPNSPLFLSQCEKSYENKVSLDWLGFSSCRSFDEIFYALRQIWPDLSVKISNVSMPGYPKTKAFFLGTIQYGLIGYDAKMHNRISVSLSGVACKTICSIDQFLFLHDVLILLDARLSRVDLCLDFFRGEITYDYAFWAWQNGRFKNKNATHNPPHKVISGVDANGRNSGRTLYVGNRSGEVFIRVYEKGLEVFANMPLEYRLQCTERENQRIADNPDLSGSIADDWVRVEVVFKRKEKTRPIPMNILLDRDQFFAGVNPFFSSLLPLATGLGRGSLKENKEITHDKLINAHRASYGNHLHSLRQIGFTDTEIVDLLDTGIHNQKLLKSGLIDIEKKAFNDAARLIDPDFDIPF